MSIFDDIADGFTKAADAIADGTTASFDFTKDVLGKGAVTVVGGGLLFTQGWRDVFSGQLQQGFSEVAFGLAKAAGVPIPGVGDPLTQQYQDIVGAAAQWSLQQSQSQNAQVCYTTYAQHVKDNILAQGLKWTDDMAQPLHDGAAQMSWINLGC